jgi:hypothetical protein
VGWCSLQKPGICYFLIGLGVGMVWWRIFFGVVDAYDFESFWLVVVKPLLPTTSIPFTQIRAVRPFSSDLFDMEKVYV